jgi:hypothetical protein
MFKNNTKTTFQETPTDTVPSKNNTPQNKHIFHHTNARTEGFCDIGFTSHCVTCIHYIKSFCIFFSSNFYGRWMKHDDDGKQRGKHCILQDRDAQIFQ